MTENEIDQIVEFLFTLTDERFAQQNKRQFEQQKKQAQEERPLRDNEMAFRLKLAFEK